MFHISSIFTLSINLLFEKYFLSSNEKLPKSQKHMNNPFLTHAPFLYSLKTTGILCFFAVYRGYKMEEFSRNGLKLFLINN